MSVATGTIVAPTGRLHDILLSSLEIVAMFPIMLILTQMAKRGREGGRDSTEGRQIWEVERLKDEEEREGGGSEKGYVFILFWLSLYISHTHTHAHTHTHTHNKYTRTHTHTHTHPYTHTHTHTNTHTHTHTHTPVSYDRALYHLNIYCTLCDLAQHTFALWLFGASVNKPHLVEFPDEMYVHMYDRVCTICCAVNQLQLVTYSCIMHYFINGSQSLTVKPRFSNTDRGSGEDKDGC